MHEISVYRGQISGSTESKLMLIKLFKDRINFTHLIQKWFSLDIFLTTENRVDIWEQRKGSMTAISSLIISLQIVHHLPLILESQTGSDQCLSGSPVSQ